MFAFRDIIEIRAIEMAVAGRLLPQHDHLAIEVNSKHVPGRQNFTICHEISHTLLPTYGREFIEDTETGQFDEDSEEELLCDIGASALLLPRLWLRRAALETGPAIGTLCRTADRFQASLQATAHKLAQLNLWPCAFVFWEEGFRKDERIPVTQDALPGLLEYGRPGPKWRVKNTYTSPSFGHFISQNKSAPDASVVTACCNVGGPLRAIERFELGHRMVEVHCESIYAPYSMLGVTRPRVISLLVPLRTSLAAAVDVSNLKLNLL